MRTFVYIRVSTDKQTFMQQQNAIDDYLKSRGMKADEVFADEGVSGSVPYKKRKLAALVEEMQEGDALVVSEISRIGRTMSDLNKFVNDELKPRKLRLIIIKMGLDLDCSNLKAVDEMILFAFGFSAQVEREMLKERTASAMDAIKKDIAEQGFHITKKGKKIDRLGTPGGMNRKALDASAEKRLQEARRNPANVFFKKYFENYKARNRGHRLDYAQLADELNNLGQTTPTGMPYTEKRARAMQQKIERLFNENIA